MKKLFFFLGFSFCFLLGRAQYVQPMGYKDYSFRHQLNIGNQGAKLTDPSAYLELGKSTGSIKGFLLPRGNKDTIASPAKGLVFYDLPSNTIVYYNGTSWLAISSPPLSYGLIYSGGIMVDTTTLKSVFTGSQANAGSGISKTSNSFHLGAQLTQDATLYGRNYSFNVGQPSTRVNSFNVYSRNGVLIQDTITLGYAPSLTMSGGSVTVQGREGMYYGNSLVTLQSAVRANITAPKLYLNADSIVAASGIDLTADTSYKELAITPTGKLVKRTPATSVADRTIFNNDDTLRNTTFNTRTIYLGGKLLYFDGGTSNNSQVKYSGNDGINIYNFHIRPLEYSVDWTSASSFLGSRTQFSSEHTRFSWGSASNFNQVLLDTTGSYLKSYATYGGLVQLEGKKINLAAVDSIVASGIPTVTDTTLKELAITATGKIVKRTPTGGSGGGVSGNDTIAVKSVFEVITGVKDTIALNGLGGINEIPDNYSIRKKAGVDEWEVWQQTYGSDYTKTGDSVFLRGAWVNAMDYGVVANGVANDLPGLNAAKAAAIALQKPLYLPAGNYTLSGGPGNGTILFELPDSLDVFGDGEKTVITWTQNDIAFQVKERTVLRNMKFVGSGKAASAQFETAVLAWDNTKWKIENVTVEEVAGSPTSSGGGGITIATLNGAGANWQDGGTISNCLLTNNKTGINLRQRGEYVHVINSTITFNTTGMRNAAGNHTVTNCHIDNNDLGLLLVGEINSGHGTFSATTFNHNIKDFEITDIALGEVFNACLFYSDESSIENSDDIEFNGCHFAPGTSAKVIDLTGNTNITRSGGKWDATTNVISGDDLKLITIPTGGTTGQVLSKSSNDNYDVTWGAGGGGGGTNSFRELRFIVGTTANAPVAGDSVFTFSGYSSKKVNVFREGELQWDSTTTDGYEFDPGTGTFTFHPSLLAGEKVIIQAYPQADWTVDVIPTPASGYETESDTYFTALATAGCSLSIPEKDAYNAWVVAEKAASRYSKYIAIYPLMGGTAACHAINAKNPGTKNISWNGSWTHDADGSRGGGTSSDYGDLGINPSTDLTINSAHFGLYINDDNTATAYDFGYYGGAAALTLARISGNAYTNMQALGDHTTTATDLLGMNIVTRVVNTEYHYVKAGTVNTKTNTSVGNPSGSMLLGMNGGAGPTPSTRRYAFVTVGTGLTSTEAQGLNSNTVTLQTALGRD